MGTKNNPGEFDCIAAAEPDEPMFILLARDPEAPGLIERWCVAREYAIAHGTRPESDRAKVGEARRCAAQMKVWRASNRQGLS